MGADYDEESISQQDSNTVNVYYIPGNAINKGRLFGIRFKHWIETVCIIGINTYLMTLSPFTLRVKGIVIVTLGAALAFIFLRGIKGRTLFEFIIYGIRDMRNRRQYHLGGIHDDRKAADKAQFEGESGLEKTIYFFKHARKTLDERYGVNEEENKENQ